LISTINTAESQYWAAIRARESLRVQQRALTTSQSQWEFVQKQFNLGAISELDTYSQQTSVMSAEVNLTQAQYSLRDSEDRIRRQIGADLDPAIRALPIQLTETIDLGPAESMDRDREMTVQKAIATHPSLRASRQTLEFADTTLARNRNSLMPQLDLGLTYSGSGNGGYLVDRAGQIYPGGGIGDALHQMFSWGSPTYGASLTLTLPIRNRQTSLDLTNSLIDKKKQMLNLRNSEQNMRQSVLLAITALDNAKKTAELKKQVLYWAQKDYEGKKTQYDLGTIALQFLVNAEQDYAVKELSYVQAQLDVRSALLSLLATTGELLDERGIVVTPPPPISASTHP
jgi:outer membrane protein TolC